MGRLILRGLVVIVMYTQQKCFSYCCLHIHRIQSENSEDSENSDNDVLSERLDHHQQTSTGSESDCFIKLTEKIHEAYKETVIECKDEIELFNEKRLQSINYKLNVNKGIGLLKQRRNAIQNNDYSKT